MGHNARFEGYKPLGRLPKSFNFKGEKTAGHSVSDHSAQLRWECAGSRYHTMTWEQQEVGKITSFSFLPFIGELMGAAIANTVPTLVTPSN